MPNEDIAGKPVDRMVTRPAASRHAGSRKRPHIVIAVVNLPVERDRRVIRECLALESAGYRVTAICPRGEAGLTRLPGTRDTAIRSFRQPLAGHGIASFALEFFWSFVCVGWHLAALSVRGRVRAVQVCNPPDIFWPLALVMRATGRKWVFDHHDLCPELYECKTDSPRPVIMRTLRLFEKLSVRCASAVTTTNESYRAIAIERDGCPPEKVTVVRNGPALTEISSEPATTPDSIGDKLQIVYLGVMGPQDRVDTAILAAERLAEMRGRTGWEMVLAGDGECMPDLRRLVDEHQLHDVVRFAGWLEATEVDTVLRRATIGIQPDPPTSMAHLSTMAKTIEYLARGLPVVAVDLRETRRSAGEAAIYVPTGSPEEFATALDALLDDEMTRKNMREVALERFRTVLAWEHQAAAYVATWQSLVPVQTTTVPAVPVQTTTVPAVPVQTTTVPVMPRQRRGPVAVEPARAETPHLEADAAGVPGAR